MESMSPPSTERRRSGHPELRGIRALTAEDGGPPDRPCVVGELVWTSDPCDDLPCQCEWGFNGIASEGLTTIAAVRHLPGTTRSEVRDALVDGMGAHGYPPAAAQPRVDRLLALAEALPAGTLVRLEHGVPVAFPHGSRMDGPGRVVSPTPKDLRRPSRPGGCADS